MKSDSNLSNKDKVKYNWNVNKDYAKYVKCNLKYKNKTYKVKGLEEVKTFDAFKDLQVSFNGISPGGAVSFDYTGSDLTSADFQMEHWQTETRLKYIWINLWQTAMPPT